MKNIVFLFGQCGLTCYGIEGPADASLLLEVFDRKALKWDEVVDVACDKTGNEADGYTFICLYEPSLSAGQLDQLKEYCPLALSPLSDLPQLLQVRQVFIQADTRYYLIDSLGKVQVIEGPELFGEAADMLTDKAEKMNLNHCFLPLREGLSRKNTHAYIMMQLAYLKYRPKALAVPIFASPDIDLMVNYHDLLPQFIIIDLDKNDFWAEIVRKTRSHLKDFIFDDTQYMLSNSIVNDFFTE